MGHTAIHPLRWLLAPLLLVHVGVAAFWFGALWPLNLIAGRESAERGRVAIAEYSKLAVRLVPWVLICGALLAVVLIRSVAELATAYGAMVLGKTAAFGVSMYLAAMNRRRFDGALAIGDAGAVRAFRRTVAAEWGVLAAVLVATALMTALFAPAHLEGAFGSHQLEPHTSSGAPAPTSQPASKPAGPRR
jgi:copper transport protein